jgi:diguanylate cyclase (GGDEF)-like protein
MSATLNGIGDVISTVVVALLFIRYTSSNSVLESERTLLFFIAFGVLLGPLVSALMGAGGLFVFRHILLTDLTSVFVTWWIGDAVGAIIFTPFLLSWLNEESLFNQKSALSITISVTYCLLLTAIAFDLLSVPQHGAYVLFMFIPLLFATLFRHGQRHVFTVQIAVLSLATIATSKGLGPFANGSQLGSLMQLQVFAAIFSVVLFRIALLNSEKERNEAKLERRSAELEELYRKDALTGLWNRYRIKEFLELELNRFKRDQKTFGLLLLDIDDFKIINDHHGHLMGDRILTELANLIKSHIREIDFLGRWGGEEFIIIISNSSESDLIAFSSKLNRLVANHTFDTDKKLTVSIGAALASKGDTELTIVDRADAGLYQAKRSGKNQTSQG